MRDVLLFGASSEALRLCHDVGYSVIAIVDPTDPKHYPDRQLIRSDIEAIRKYPNLPAIVSIDDCTDRARVFAFLELNEVTCLSLIGGMLHSPSGVGIFMQSNTFVSSDVSVGKGVRLNYGATAMHDCVLRDFVTLAPKCMLLGGVTVGESSYVGACATILPLVNIGKNCLIGAGAVVTKDVPDFMTVKGVPAK